MLKRIAGATEGDIRRAQDTTSMRQRDPNSVRSATSYSIHTVPYTRLLLNTRIRSLMFTKPPQDILMPSANVDPPNPLADINRQKPISIIFIKIASQAK